MGLQLSYGVFLNIIDFLFVNIFECFWFVLVKGSIYLKGDQLEKFVCQ